MRVSYAVRIFMLDRRASNLAQGTIRFYTEKLEMLQEHTGDVELAQVDRNVIREFLADRGRSGPILFRACKTFFNFCVAEGMIEENPIDNIRKPRTTEKIPEAFTEAEVRTILKACASRRDEAIVLFLLDTGVRAKELISIRTEDANTTTGAVSVREGKTRKERVVHMGSRCQKSVLRYLAERVQSEMLFASHDGTPLSYWGVRSVMVRLQEETGVHIHMHKFRHTCARWSLRAGMNIYAVQALLGHATLDMLKHYARLEEQDVAREHRSHGAVDAIL